MSEGCWPYSSGKVCQNGWHLVFDVMTLLNDICDPVWHLLWWRIINLYNCIRIFYTQSVQYMTSGVLLHSVFITSKQTSKIISNNEQDKRSYFSTYSPCLHIIKCLLDAYVQLILTSVTSETGLSSFSISWRIGPIAWELVHMHLAIRKDYTQRD